MNLNKQEQREQEEIYRIKKVKRKNFELQEKDERTSTENTTRMGSIESRAN